MRLFIILAILFFSVDGLLAQKVETTSKMEDVMFRKKDNPFTRELKFGVKQVEIPFEFENNFILVDVVFNNIIPLRFIFDTGAEHTILTRREITDILGVPYQRRFTVIGADLKTELHAYLVRNIHLKVGQINARNQSLLVLEDDYFRFEEFTGEKIHGIIGADFFKGFIVKIDFIRSRITLTSVSHFKEPKDYMKIPIEVKRQKPYLNTEINLRQDTIVPVKLLLDTGAGLSLIVNSDTHPDLEPPVNAVKGSVGLGLGGDLDGYLGRINHLDIADVTLDDVVTNFQALPEGMDTTHLNGRNGLIGTKILSRFTMIIDYPRETLYLKTNKKIKEAFKFDKSGLQIIASGVNLNTFIVQNVIKNSPAAEADLREGDIIKSINGVPVVILGMSSLLNKLKKKTGKKIVLKIKREKKRIKKVFYLKEII